MAPYFGFDTTSSASAKILGEGSPWIIGAPNFWGRYVNGDGSAQYAYSESENDVLHSLGIPVIFFARQTNQVGNAGKAVSHATQNMKGVVDALGAQYLSQSNAKPMIFLDVEEESQASNVLSVEYYKNWAGTISAGYSDSGYRIPFSPAVYLNLGNSKQSWVNLHQACAQGAACIGVSVAYYWYNSLHNPPPPTSLHWDSQKLTPAPNPLPAGTPSVNIPTLIWQYHGDYLTVEDSNGKVIRQGDIDFNLINPDYVNLLYHGCVMPPPAAVA